MLGTVKLDHKLGFWAIKVYDICTDSTLTVKVDWIGTEKVIPEVLLFFGHVFRRFFALVRFFFSYSMTAPHFCRTNNKAWMSVYGCPSFDKEGCPERGGVVETV